VINPSEAGTVPIPNRWHPETDSRDTLRFTDLELQEQSKQVRGGDGCCQGQHIPTPVLEMQR